MLIFPLPSLSGNIRSYHRLTSMLPHRIHKIAFPPKLPSPKLAFHFRNFCKDFPRNHALYLRRYLTLEKSADTSFLSRP